MSEGLSGNKLTLTYECLQNKSKLEAINKVLLQMTVVRPLFKQRDKKI